MTPTDDPTPTTTTDTDTTTSEPALLPALVDRLTAARLCGMSESTWDRWRKYSLTPPEIQRGKKLLWCREELEAWAREGCPPRKKWMPLWAELKRKRK